MSHFTIPRTELVDAISNMSLEHLSMAADWTLNCRCGVVTPMGPCDLDKVVTDMGKLIQCGLCGDLSHISCQRDGRADRLGKKAFHCDQHDHRPFHLRNIYPIHNLGKYFKKTPLTKRLCIGKAALGRRGTFWYPLRLLDRVSTQEGVIWQVKWWRGCDTSLAASITNVSEEDLIDSMYGDRVARRQVRLGRWNHAVNAPSSDDILDDPQAVPYNSDVHEALCCAEGILRALLKDPASVNSRFVPAKRFLEKERSSLTTIIPFTAGLSRMEICRISNWFETHIADNNPALRRLWSTGLALAHARTVYLASRDFGAIGAQLSEKSLRSAWNLLRSLQYVNRIEIDVDREAVQRLEELMFEMSQAAGVAGYWQWGLDAGDHEGKWDPYAGLPGHWNKADRDDSESEIQRGPDYVSIIIPPPVKETKRPRPRPRPKMRPPMDMH